jgi:hypothetical protein
MSSSSSNNQTESSSNNQQQNDIDNYYGQLKSRINRVKNGNKIDSLVLELMKKPENFALFKKMIDQHLRKSRLSLPEKKSIFSPQQKGFFAGSKNIGSICRLILQFFENLPQASTQNKGNGFVSSLAAGSEIPNLIRIFTFASTGKDPEDEDPLQLRPIFQPYDGTLSDRVKTISGVKNIKQFVEKYLSDEFSTLSPDVIKSILTKYCVQYLIDASLRYIIEQSRDIVFNISETISVINKTVVGRNTAIARVYKALGDGNCLFNATSLSYIDPKQRSPNLSRVTGLILKQKLYFWLKNILLSDRNTQITHFDQATHLLPFFGDISSQWRNTDIFDESKVKVSIRKWIEYSGSIGINNPYNIDLSQYILQRVSLIDPDTTTNNVSTKWFTSLNAKQRIDILIDSISVEGLWGIPFHISLLSTFLQHNIVVLSRNEQFVFRPLYRLNPNDSILTIYLVNPSQAHYNVLTFEIENSGKWVYDNILFKSVLGTRVAGTLTGKDVTLPSYRDDQEKQEIEQKQALIQSLNQREIQSVQQLLRQDTKQLNQVIGTMNREIYTRQLENYINLWRTRTNVIETSTSSPSRPTLKSIWQGYMMNDQEYSSSQQQMDQNDNDDDSDDSFVVLVESVSGKSTPLSTSEVKSFLKRVSKQNTSLKKLPDPVDLSIVQNKSIAKTVLDFIVNVVPYMNLLRYYYFSSYVDGTRPAQYQKIVMEGNGEKSVFVNTDQLLNQLITINEKQSSTTISNTLLFEQSAQLLLPSYTKYNVGDSPAFSDRVLSRLALSSQSGKPRLVFLVSPNDTRSCMLLLIHNDKTDSLAPPTSVYGNFLYISVSDTLKPLFGTKPGSVFKRKDDFDQFIQSYQIQTCYVFDTIAIPTDQLTRSLDLDSSSSSSQDPDSVAFQRINDMIVESLGLTGKTKQEVSNTPQYLSSNWIALYNSFSQYSLLPRNESLLATADVSSEEYANRFGSALVNKIYLEKKIIENTRVNINVYRENNNHIKMFWLMFCGRWFDTLYNNKTPFLVGTSNQDILNYISIPLNTNIFQGEFGNYTIRNSIGVDEFNHIINPTNISNTFYQSIQNSSNGSNNLQIYHPILIINVESGSIKLIVYDTFNKTYHQLISPGYFRKISEPKNANNLIYYSIPHNPDKYQKFYQEFTTEFYLDSTNYEGSFNSMKLRGISNFDTDVLECFTESLKASHPMVTPTQLINQTRMNLYIRLVVKNWSAVRRKLEGRINTSSTSSRPSFLVRSGGRPRRQDEEARKRSIAESKAWIELHLHFTRLVILEEISSDDSDQALSKMHYLLYDYAYNLPNSFGENVGFSTPYGQEIPFDNTTAFLVAMNWNILVTMKPKGIFDPVYMEFVFGANTRLRNANSIPNGVVFFYRGAENNSSRLELFKRHPINTQLLYKHNIIKGEPRLILTEDLWKQSDRNGIFSNSIEVVISKIYTVEGFKPSTMSFAETLYSRTNTRVGRASGVLDLTQNQNQFIEVPESSLSLNTIRSSSNPSERYRDISIPEDGVVLMHHKNHEKMVKLKNYLIESNMPDDFDKYHNELDKIKPGAIYTHYTFFGDIPISTSDINQTFRKFCKLSISQSLSESEKNESIESFRFNDATEFIKQIYDQNSETTQKITASFLNLRLSAPTEIYKPFIEKTGVWKFQNDLENYYVKKFNQFSSGESQSKTYLKKQKEFLDTFEDNSEIPERKDGKKDIVNKISDYNTRDYKNYNTDITSKDILACIWFLQARTTDRSYESERVVGNPNNWGYLEPYTGLTLLLESSYPTPRASNPSQPFFPVRLKSAVKVTDDSRFMKGVANISAGAISGTFIYDFQTGIRLSRYVNEFNENDDDENNKYIGYGAWYPSGSVGDLFLLSSKSIAPILNPNPKEGYGFFSRLDSIYSLVSSKLSYRIIVDTLKPIQKSIFYQYSKLPNAVIEDIDGRCDVQYTNFDSLAAFYFQVIKFVYAQKQSDGSYKSNPNKQGNTNYKIISGRDLADSKNPFDLIQTMKLLLLSPSSYEMNNAVQSSSKLTNSFENFLQVKKTLSPVFQEYYGLTSVKTSYNITTTKTSDDSKLMISPKFAMTLAALNLFSNPKRINRGVDDIIDGPNSKNNPYGTFGVPAKEEFYAPVTGLFFPGVDYGNIHKTQKKGDLTTHTSTIRSANNNPIGSRRLNTQEWLPLHVKFPISYTQVTPKIDLFLRGVIQDETEYSSPEWCLIANQTIFEKEELGFLSATLWEIELHDPGRNTNTTDDNNPLSNYLHPIYPYFWMYYIGEISFEFISETDNSLESVKKEFWLEVDARNYSNKIRYVRYTPFKSMANCEFVTNRVNTTTYGFTYDSNDDTRWMLNSKVNHNGFSSYESAPLIQLRTTKRVERGQELLVYYDMEIVELLYDYMSKKVKNSNKQFITGIGEPRMHKYNIDVDIRENRKISEKRIINNTQRYLITDEERKSMMIFDTLVNSQFLISKLRKQIRKNIPENDRVSIREINDVVLVLKQDFPFVYSFITNFINLIRVEKKKVKKNIVNQTELSSNDFKEFKKIFDQWQIYPLNRYFARLLSIKITNLDSRGVFSNVKIENNRLVLSKQEQINSVFLKTKSKIKQSKEYSIANHLEKLSSVMINVLNETNHKNHHKNIHSKYFSSLLGKEFYSKSDSHIISKMLPLYTRQWTKAAMSEEPKKNLEKLDQISSKYIEFSLQDKDQSSLKVWREWHDKARSFKPQQKISQDIYAHPGRDSFHYTSLSIGANGLGKLKDLIVEQRLTTFTKDNWYKIVISHREKQLSNMNSSSSSSSSSSSQSNVSKQNVNVEYPSVFFIQYLILLDEELILQISTFDRETLNKLSDFMLQVFCYTYNYVYEKIDTRTGQDIDIKADSITSSYGTYVTIDTEHWRLMLIAFVKFYVLEFKLENALYLRKVYNQLSGMTYDNAPEDIFSVPGGFMSRTGDLKSKYLTLKEKYDKAIKIYKKLDSLVNSRGRKISTLKRQKSLKQNQSKKTVDLDKISNLQLEVIELDDQINVLEEDIKKRDKAQENYKMLEKETQIAWEKLTRARKIEKQTLRDLVLSVDIIIDALADAITLIVHDIDYYFNPSPEDIVTFIQYLASANSSFPADLVKLKYHSTNKSKNVKFSENYVLIHPVIAERTFYHFVEKEIGGNPLVNELLFSKSNTSSTSNNDLIRYNHTLQSMSRVAQSQLEKNSLNSTQVKVQSIGNNVFLWYMVYNIIYTLTTYNDRVHWDRDENTRWNPLNDNNPVNTLVKIARTGKTVDIFEYSQALACLDSYGLDILKTALLNSLMEKGNSLDKVFTSIKSNIVEYHIPGVQRRFVERLNLDDLDEYGTESQILIEILVDIIRYSSGLPSRVLNIKRSSYTSSDMNTLISRQKEALKKLYSIIEDPGIFGQVPNPFVTESIVGDYEEIIRHAYEFPAILSIHVKNINAYAFPMNLAIDYLLTTKQNEDKDIPNGDLDSVMVSFLIGQNLSQTITNYDNNKFSTFSNAMYNYISHNADDDVKSYFAPYTDNYSGDLNNQDNNLKISPTDPFKKHQRDLNFAPCIHRLNRAVNCKLIDSKLMSSIASNWYREYIQAGRLFVLSNDLSESKLLALHSEYHKVLKHMFTSIQWNVSGKLYFAQSLFSYNQYWSYPQDLIWKDCVAFVIDEINSKNLPPNQGLESYAKSSRAIISNSINDYWINTFNQEISDGDTYQYLNIINIIPKLVIESNAGLVFSKVVMFAGDVVYQNKGPGTYKKYQIELLKRSINPSNGVDIGGLLKISNLQREAPLQQRNHFIVTTFRYRFYNILKQFNIIKAPDSFTIFNQNEKNQVLALSNINNIDVSVYVTALDQIFYVSRNPSNPFYLADIIKDLIVNRDNYYNYIDSHEPDYYLSRWIEAVFSTKEWKENRSLQERAKFLFEIYDLFESRAQYQTEQITKSVPTSSSSSTSSTSNSNTISIRRISVRDKKIQKVLRDQILKVGYKYPGYIDMTKSQEPIKTLLDRPDRFKYHPSIVKSHDFMVNFMRKFMIYVLTDKSVDDISKFIISYRLEKFGEKFDNKFVGNQLTSFFYASILTKQTFTKTYEFFRSSGEKSILWFSHKIHINHLWSTLFASLVTQQQVPRHSSTPNFFNRQLVPRYLTQFEVGSVLKFPDKFKDELMTFEIYYPFRKPVSNQQGQRWLGRLKNIFRMLITLNLLPNYLLVEQYQYEQEDSEKINAMKQAIGINNYNQDKQGINQEVIYKTIQLYHLEEMVINFTKDICEIGEEATPPIMLSWNNQYIDLYTRPLYELYLEKNKILQQSSSSSSSSSSNNSN